MRITLLILLILSVLCSKITDSNESILIKPAISFMKNNEPVTPEFIKKIIITVIFGNETIKDTFSFDAHKGTVNSFIPKNTPFRLKLEALDKNSIVIYYSGELEYSGFTKDETIKIEANQVTPKLPEGLTIHFISDSKRILTWSDKSFNEEGFIIKRGQQGSNRFLVIDTVDTNIFIDSSTIQNTSVYLYRVIAYNSVGESHFAVIPVDPKEIASTPNKPTSVNDTLYVNLTFPFETESAVCGNGHPAEYQFDWGNDTLSEWLSKPISSYSWNKEGKYSIKSRIRCSKNRNVLSSWSEALEIIVTKR